MITAPSQHDRKQNPLGDRVGTGILSTWPTCAALCFAAAALVNRLEGFQKQYQYQLDKFLMQLDEADLPICYELGCLSFGRTGARLLFQVFADRYERRSLMITSNLPFSEWVQVFQGERQQPYWTA